MSRPPEEPMFYKHEQLIDDINEMHIRIKVHQSEETTDLKTRYPKPTTKELDDLLSRIVSVLKEDKKPMRRY